MLKTPEKLFFESKEMQPLSGREPSLIIDQCRSLVARKYVEVGYVREDDLDINGHLGEEIDPYVEDSEYFWKADDDGGIMATLRIIHPSEANPLLPIEKSFNLFSEQSKILQKACDENPRSVVEISALAKAREFDRVAALDMYKAVWQHAKRTNLELCAISADIRLYGMLSQTFGSSIEVAGDSTEMMGSETVPSFLFPDRCAEAVADIYMEKVASGKNIRAESYRNLIEYLIDGLEVEYLSDQEVRAFESMGLIQEFYAIDSA